jgi:hypothetical protein
MVECGQLPEPYFIGRNRDIKRWLWEEVVRKIAGERITEEQREPFFRGLASGKT